MTILPHTILNYYCFFNWSEEHLQIANVVLFKVFKFFFHKNASLMFLYSHDQHFTPVHHSSVFNVAVYVLNTQ